MSSRLLKPVFWLLLGWLTASAAHATIYPLAPDSDVIGQVKVVYATAEDTLIDIARRHSLGYDEIVHANPGVDRWAPGAGNPIVLPTRYILPDTPREGIVLNIAEMRLYYYPKANGDEPRTVATYPVSIGRMDWKTPMGLTKVVAKDIDPPWRPPASIKAEHAAEGDILPDVIPGGPDNPLGRFAMRLGVPGYLIHGTNKPYGIGMRVTHGCVRMYPEDIERLFGMTSVGTPVRLVDQPVKVGRFNGILMVESHEPLAEDNLPIKVTLDQALQAVAAKIGPDLPGVDQATLEVAVQQASGIPVAIHADPGTERPAEAMNSAPPVTADPVANRTPIYRSPSPADAAPLPAYRPIPTQPPAYIPPYGSSATGYQPSPPPYHQYPVEMPGATSPIVRPAPINPTPYPRSAPPTTRPSAEYRPDAPIEPPPVNRL